MSANLSAGDKNLEQLNAIVLLRIKTVVLRNLKKTDIPEFTKILEKKDSNEILAFASKKIPNITQLIGQEVQKISQEVSRYPA